MARHGSRSSARSLDRKFSLQRKKIPARFLPGGYSLQTSCFYAVFFICLTLAQRALWAAAIFRRAATESRLRLGLV